MSRKLVVSGPCVEYLLTRVDNDRNACHNIGAHGAQSVEYLVSRPATGMAMRSMIECLLAHLKAEILVIDNVRDPAGILFRVDVGSPAIKSGENVV